MLEVFASSILLSCAAFYVIKTIIESKAKLLSFKNSILIVILAVLTVVLRKIDYTGVETFIIFLLNIVIYKIIFKIQLEESTIAVCIMMAIIFVGDYAVSVILKSFISADMLRGHPLFIILSSISVCLFEMLVIRIRAFKNILCTFYKHCQKNKSISNIVFFVLLISGLCILTRHMSTEYDNWNVKYFINTILVVILAIITYIFIENKNSYIKLTDEYDNLFSYIQNFEEWIEKEQLNRHEYKNQLAVLYCLTKEKAVKDKINEILDDNINIDGEVINELKQLPKGGIKGLMYYKVAIAQKKKVNVTADISLKTKSILNKLSEKEIRTLCKLIGIYLDNAIEAAVETRKKNLSIEIYELSDKVCFIFSNSFKKTIELDEINKKGVTTKGEGHGNGLYFATKLLDSNEWLEAKSEVIDRYYIQKLIIKK